MGEPTPRQPFPSWKQGLLIFAGGIVLAASSCAAFLGTMDSKDPLPVVFAVGFFAGVAGTIAGAILVLVRAIRGPGTRS
jgi:hypothetical protein